MRLVAAAAAVLAAASVAAGQQPAQSFRDCPECPEMVVIPAGTFEMGSPPTERDRYDRVGDDREGPQRTVRIAALALGKYEVTFAEWDACVADKGCAVRPLDRDAGWGRGRRPVMDVAWEDAKSYAEWLSKKTGKRYRLPSEAEWEYAARAGTTTRFHWGDDVGRDNANCKSCGSKFDDERTAPVGSFAPNRFGLHDMHGNVAEWVEDCWNDNHRDAPVDGAARTGGACYKRVIRGGSFYDVPAESRAAHRVAGMTEVRSFVLGFRVARSP
jgi:formylglycine-generating enzyme required for sulfatase activity